MLDAISEARLALVHPELARRIRNLADQLAARGITIRITQGLRTWSEQQAIYNQGRTTPGKIVTDAKPGYSAHNFGYAVDFVVMNDGFPDWNDNDVQWLSVLSLALSCGLAEGAKWRTFPDRPHLYLQELPADPDDNMRDIFLSAGMDKVWDSWTPLLGDFHVDQAIDA